MSAKAIGYVVELVGSAEVRTAEGIIKVINIGDVVREGDVVISGINSEVEIAFYNDHKLKVGSQAEVFLDETVSFESGSYNNQQVDQAINLQDLQNSEQNPDQDDQVFALQDAIEKGIDLADLEATAGGVTPNNSQRDGLHTSSDYEREGTEGIVDTEALPIATFGNAAETNFLGEGDLDDLDQGDTPQVPPVNSAPCTCCSR